MELSSKDHEKSDHAHFCTRATPTFVQLRTCSLLAAAALESIEKKVVSKTSVSILYICFSL